MSPSQILKYLWVSLTAVGFCVFISNSWGPLPALGPLLSPFTGIWQNLPRPILETEELEISGLKDEVQIKWDEHGVPHIFAQNDEDLYFAQGYVVARDRLFQMDIHSRPAAGTLSEVAGEATRNLDRFFIQMGMREASQTSYEAILEDPLSKLAVEAYSAGINAYIKSLKPKDYPPEYRILGAQPSLWTPNRTAHFLKTMAYNLSGRTYDLFLSLHAQKLGLNKTEFLFPDVLPFKADEFIFTNEEFKAAGNVPSAPEQFSAFITQLKTRPFYPQPDANNGSNNFAVGPKKSKTGFSIFANDTHLGLSLPPIWYEMQLSSPSHNVYGATFPGGPGIILGFNSEVAWGVTNGTTDVLDWYEVEFKDKDSLEYLVDGKWELAKKTKQILKVRNSSAEKVELIETRFGYVVLREEKLGLAIKWSVHKKSNELKAFLELDRAKSFKECHKAIEGFKSPSQNFLCADPQNVSLHHQGAFPKRFQGQGKYIMNGRDSRLDWKEWLRSEELPQSINPDRGFVRSANNPPTGSEAVYLGWDYEEPFRARRIRQVLEEKPLHTPEDLMLLQNDIHDLHAKEALPELLKHLDFDKLSAQQKEVIENLRRWDFSANPKNSEPTIFEAWWKSFEEELFEDELGRREESFYPRRRRTLQIFSSLDQWKEWIDRKDTDQEESLTQIIHASFLKAWSKLEEQHGPISDKWNWGKARPTELKHVARIPGFGSGKQEFSGTRYTVKANGGNHGPTWKLVVSLEPERKAWSYISGHSTGHPFSSNYQKLIEPWGKGEMKPVYFFKSLTDPKMSQMKLRTSRLVGTPRGEK